MVGESIAIIFILLCIVFVFIRSGHIDYALGVVPIILVSASHLMGVPIAKVIYSFHGISPYLIRCFVDVAGLALACVLTAIFSTHISSSQNKKVYLVITTIYCVVLTCVYIQNLIAVVLV